MGSCDSPDILFVEDDQEYVEAALAALKRERVSPNIFVVRDGAEALEFLFSRGRYVDRNGDKRPPKVILLDLHLPEVNGLEVLRELKKHPKTACVPVVMLTSSQERDDILASHQGGADVYFVKPSHAREFSHLSHILVQFGVSSLKQSPAVQ